ncbi:PREDICTED: uncharacterized protein LOC109334194 [Lupinus angustifolius]|uniref:uncharacterized protein LOC109334194 n=1 Tax=Lupinus angustifolius TaxID=3871 RepID=UPI00092F788E|nr:PREDICTED: uncharacterized protein LOC109334194 [Lupinus angustifolius]
MNWKMKQGLNPVETVMVILWRESRHKAFARRLLLVSCWSAVPRLMINQVFRKVTVGLFKLFSDHQTQQLCLSALHLSSGYSFSLTWISKAPEKEAELLYHVLFLGTFERVASEWMREDIMFSPYMCPVFFERVSRVIKLNH